MRMRRLGNSSIDVAPIAVGCWSFGGGEYWGEQRQADVDRVVAAALDAGVNLFDTAELYNAGESERSLGRALAGQRHRAVVCSKVGPDGAYRDELIQRCEASLRRLNTDYLDVYMLHWPVNPTSVRHFTGDERKIAHPPTACEAFDALAALKRAGKIRSIGVSNFGPRQLAEALSFGVQIDINEMPYNLFSRAIETEVLPLCRAHGVSIIGSMALQQGILAGAYQRADQIPFNQAHSRHFHHLRGQGTSRHGGDGAEDEMFTALAELRAVAEEAGASLAQLAIAWVLHREGVAATLVGNRNAHQLAENLAALRVRLTSDQIARLDRITLPVLTKLGDNPDYYESAENRRIW